MRATILWLIFLLSILLSSCKKENPGIIHTETEKPNLEKKSAYPGEIMTIYFDDKLNNTVYHQTFNNEDIKMVSVGNRLSFKVPLSVEDCLHELSLKVDGLSYSFYLDVKKAKRVEAPNSFLSDFIFDENEQIQDIKEIQDVMLAIGLMDTSMRKHDVATWNSLGSNEQLQEVGDLTSSQKQYLADVLAVNRGWMSKMDQKLLGQNIYEHSSNEQSSQCIESMKVSKQFWQNENLLASRGERINAFWCSVDSIDKTNPAEILSKVGVLLVSDFSFADQIILHTIGRKIDLIAKMIASIAGSPSIAQKIMPGTYVPNQGQTVKFCHKEKKELEVAIKFRSVRKSSINTPAADDAFSRYFNNFINYYNDYRQTLGEKLSWQPRFHNRSREVSFNRYLTIPDSTITNEDVTIVKSEFHNHKWQVVVNNKMQSPQHFNCQMIYNDGHAKIKGAYIGKVEPCEP